MLVDGALACVVRASNSAALAAVLEASAKLSSSRHAELAAKAIQTSKCGFVRVARAMLGLVPEWFVRGLGAEVHLALLVGNARLTLTDRTADMLARIWYRNEAGWHTSEALGVLTRSGADLMCLAPYAVLARERGVAWAHDHARNETMLYTEYAE